MGLATLRERQLIRMNGAIFRLEHRLPDGLWFLLETRTGQIEQRTEHDLWMAFERRELLFVMDDKVSNPSKDHDPYEPEQKNTEPSPNSLVDEERNNAINRWHYVRDFDGRTPGLSAEDVIVATWQRLQWPSTPPTTRTIYLWRAKAKNASDPIAALVSADAKKGRFEPRHDPVVRDLAEATFKEHYMNDNPRITIAKTVEKLRDAVALENDRRPKADRLARPGRRAIQRLIDMTPKREILAARFGADVAHLMLRVSLGGVETTRVLERCETDHTPLSVIVLDEDFMPWGRATACVSVDYHANMPTGVYFGAESPGIVSVARCIRCSVSPKFELLKKFPDVKGTWAAFGVHDTYVFDNALESHAKALRQACSQLGGSWVELSPRASPWFKPAIERYFRTQDQDLLHTLPATTLENIMTRGDFNPKTDMVLRRSVFEKIFMKWLVDVYMRDPQKALGKLSPADAWKKSIGLADQFVPTRTVLLERLFLRKEIERRLDHEGIEFDCLIYNSVELGTLRAQLGAVLTVDIWVSDEDLGHILVEVPGREFSIRVPCLDFRYADGLTRWQHEKCKKMRRIGNDEGRELSLAQARQCITEMINTESDELRHARKKARSRFTEKTRPDRTRIDESANPPPSTCVASASDEELLRADSRASPILKTTIGSAKTA